MPMPYELLSEEQLEQARTEVKDATMMVFCSMLQKTGLSPMMALRLCAEAIGSVYQDVADAHRGDGRCNCGWAPQPALDLAALRNAVFTLPEFTSEPDLASLQVAGTA